MQAGRIQLGSGLVLALLVFLLAPAQAGPPSLPPVDHVAPAPPGGCAPAWQWVPSPNPGVGYNELAGISAAAANDIWAVGNYIDGQLRRSLAMHWDGLAWAVVPTPNGVMSTWFSGVAAAPGEAWAVGATGLYHTDTVAAYWDGNVWQTLPPTYGGRPAGLEGAAIIGPHDAWLVGKVRLANYHPQESLALRADPTTMTRIPSPNLHTDDILRGVAVAGRNDAWAVGSYDDTGIPHWPLIEQWNGHAWTIPPLLFPDNQDRILNAVAAISATDVWAVGSIDQAPGTLPLILHWDGTAWRGTPNLGITGVLYGVAGSGPNDVWAVGDTVTNPFKTLVLHWDGTAWSRVPVIDPGVTDTLRAVTVLSPTDVWVAGNYQDAANGRWTLAEHYAPTCLSTTAANR